MSNAAISIIAWTPRPSGNLLGFCDARLPSGMILHEIGILKGKDGAWATPPAKTMIDRDGRALTDAAGKRRYTPVISFADAETKRRFSASVIEALQRAHPEALP
ncbi:hypothetical protein [Acidiphilium sp.]|uniref:hypothetical protein n=1 Tax=Acidiphilium sp. TaxID=527 RepID=UPI002582CB07|nr:hypothetical protein [Acidiphilium sp.]